MVRVVCIEKITGCNISQDRPPLTPVRKTYAGLICRKILRVAGDQHTIFIQGTGPDDRIREFKSMLALPSALAIAVNRRYPPKARRRLTQMPLQRDPIQAFDTNASTTARVAVLVSNTAATRKLVPAARRAHPQFRRC